MPPVKQEASQQQAKLKSINQAPSISVLMLLATGLYKYKRFNKNCMELALESPTFRLVLDNQRVGIGRLPTNQLVLDDPQVSGLHAEVIRAVCLLILGAGTVHLLMDTV